MLKPERLHVEQDGIKATIELQVGGVYKLPRQIAGQWIYAGKARPLEPMETTEAPLRGETTALRDAARGNGGARWRQR